MRQFNLIDTTNDVSYTFNVFDYQCYKAEHNTIRVQSSDALKTFTIAGVSYTTDADKNAVIDYSDIVRSGTIGSTYTFTISVPNATAQSVGYAIVDTFPQVTDNVELPHIFRFLQAGTFNFVTSVDSGEVVQVKEYGTWNTVSGTQIGSIYAYSVTISTYTTALRIVKTQAGSAYAMTYSLPYGNYENTTKFVQLVRLKKCDRKRYITLKWSSGHKQYTFEIVGRVFITNGSQELETLTSGYSVQKGMSLQYAIQTDEMNANERAYFSDLCVAGDVQVVIDGSSAKYNDQNVEIADTDNTNTLDDEIKALNFKLNVAHYENGVK